MTMQLLAVLLLPPLQHLGVLSKFSLALQELLSELGVQRAQLMMPCFKQIPNDVGWLYDHAYGCGFHSFGKINNNIRCHRTYRTKHSNKVLCGDHQWKLL